MLSHLLEAGRGRNLSETNAGKTTCQTRYR
nr:MAG TPA: hypothetical protein [Caudoviricetes sp.]